MAGLSYANLCVSEALKKDMRRFLGVRCAFPCSLAIHTPSLFTHPRYLHILTTITSTLTGP